MQYSDKTYINFKNNSAYSVAIYYNDNPNYNDSIFATVNANTEKKVELNDNIIGESTFYFVYNFDLGNGEAVFPYFSSDSSINHKSAKIIENTITTITIDNITKCKTKSAFLLLENQTTSDIYIKVGNIIIEPYNASDKLVAQSHCAVYPIGGENGDFELEAVSLAKICVNSKEIDLPEIDYEAGKIYSVVVSNDEATLKSISPFDVDTQRQIWTSEPILSKYTVDCVRGAYDVSDGSFFAGAVKNRSSTFYIQSFDVYGNPKKSGEFTILESDVVSVSVIDALQCSDKEYLLLLRGYTDSSDSDSYPTNSFFYLGKFNINTNDSKIVNLTGFVQDAQGLSFENFYFYGNLVKGAICEISSSKFSVCGSVFDLDGKMHYFAAIADFSSDSPEISSHWVSDDFCEENVLRTLASSYFDGTNLYACGFNDFDGKYSTLVHKGVIFKFNSDLSSHEEIRSIEKSLFFGIVGKNGKYYVCGEAMGAASNNDLYGCFLSSDKISESPVKFSSTKKNAWFTQINFTNYGLVMCGVNSEDTAGEITSDADGILVCVSSSGEKLWENEYSSYYRVVSMAENKIGTQVLHLKTKTGTNKIVSTDLLGNAIQ